MVVPVLDLSEKHTIISDITFAVRYMYSIGAQVLRTIRGAGRGSVVTQKDLLHLGSRAAVDQALSRLARAGVLRRVGRGLYHYPKISPRLGVLSPVPDVVARAVARKTGSRLQVTGAQAANSLGLSTQVPARATFVTDGLTRQIRLGSQVIQLRRAVPKRLAGAGKRWGTVFQALAYLGRDHVEPSVVRRLRSALSHDDRRSLVLHAGYAPDWMRPVIDQIARGPMVLSRPLHGLGAPKRLPRTSPAQRVSMMWQLAVDAWAFTGESVGESRLQRDVVRVFRGGR
jgi:hypothetical protein